MKTIIEMVYEAADKDKDDPVRHGLITLTTEEFERFATIVKAARDAELREGVEMPEPKTYLGVDEEPDFTYYTANQLRETVAAAVLRERTKVIAEFVKAGAVSEDGAIVAALKGQP